MGLCFKHRLVFYRGKHVPTIHVIYCKFMSLCDVGRERERERERGGEGEGEREREREGQVRKNDTKMFDSSCRIE